MAKQTIDRGTMNDPATGDSLYVGAGKINDNFDELYVGISEQSDMAQTDTAASDYVKNKNRVINVLTSRNFQQTDDDAILLVGADVTLTLTSTLQDDFSCNILVRGAFTCTIADGGETLHAPDGLDIIEDGMGLLLHTNTEYILKI